MSDSTPSNPDTFENVIRGFVADIGRRWRGAIDLNDLIDDQLIWIEGALEQLGEAAAAESRKTPELIKGDVGDLPLFEASHLAGSLLQLLENDKDRAIPADVRYVFVGLASRAISTFNEIAILLDNGYARGAKARWRTLSEILVVARVLTAGSRHTATRYKEHRWVVLARKRERLGQFEWASEYPTPEIMRKRLCRRFGEAYGGEYGWAAVVVADRLNHAKPAWWHLTKIAGVDELRSRVLDAHESVHGGDPLGFLGTVADPDGGFHAGPSGHEVLPVARDSVRLFRQVMSALFANYVRFSSTRKPTICEAVLDGHILNLEQDLGFRILSSDPGARANFVAAMSNLYTPAGSTSPEGAL